MVVGGSSAFAPFSSSDVFDLGDPCLEFDANEDGHESCLGCKREKIVNQNKCGLEKKLLIAISARVSESRATSLTLTVHGKRRNCKKIGF